MHVSLKGVSRVPGKEYNQMRGPMAYCVSGSWITAFTVVERIASIVANAYLPVPTANLTMA